MYSIFDARNLLFFSTLSNYLRLPLQLQARSHIGEPAISLARKTIESLIPDENQKIGFKRIHKSGGGCFSVLDAVDAKKIFLAKMKSTLDTLPGAPAGEGDPFEDPGCLAWVMKPPAADAKLLADVDSWAESFKYDDQKIADEVASEAKKRKAAEGDSRTATRRRGEEEAGPSRTERTVNDNDSRNEEDMDDD